jgi:tetratricopeptide (TPR) repeat protein
VLITLSSSIAYAGGASWRIYVREGENRLEQSELAASQKCFELAVGGADKSSKGTLNLVACQNKLANVLTLENKTAAAKAVYARSLNLLEQAYGCNSPKLSQTLFALGSIYEAEGEHAEATKYYARAISINETHFSSYNPAVSFGDNNIERDARANSLEAKKLKLSDEPGLDASQAMVNSLSNFNEDLMKRNENSDQDLVAEFQKQISQSSVNALASSKLPGSSARAKQGEAARRSSDI